jgi:biopolymer transport protein ExbD
VAIDMTPMVDVAFLLLIFFMTTTSFKPPEEVVIQLPVSHAEYKVPDTDVLIMTIDKEGVLYSQLGTHDPMARVEPGQATQLIRQERVKNPKIRVIVKADKNCAYGAMEDMMNSLQESGATRFVLMTEGEVGGPGGTKEMPTDEELQRERGAGDVGALFGDPAAAPEVVIAGDATRRRGALTTGSAPHSLEDATWPE